MYCIKINNLEFVFGMCLSVCGGVWSDGRCGGTARVSEGGQGVDRHTLILLHLLCRLHQKEMCV